MDTILRGLLSGFVVGIVCVAYVLVRSWRVESQVNHKSSGSADNEEISDNWMMMAFFSSASIIWGLLGALVFRFLEDHTKFFLISTAVGIVISLAFYRTKVRYVGDKIVLTLIIMIGLGFLIPNLIPN